LVRLGVNVDHVATVRQARQSDVPDPVTAALLAEKAGADGITAHLREDRRHIQERDVELLCGRVKTKVNLEMGVTPELLALAEKFHPQDACFVPERRQELTTEGGLDVVAYERKIRQAVERLQTQGILVSLFVDPDKEQIEASKRVGAHAVEIHTGRYCNASAAEQEKEKEAVAAAARLAHTLSLEVHAGHGLNYENVGPIAMMPEVVELNIGHSIIARAVIVGIEQAVREMKEILSRARAS
jgi:pyridoxine 5-phosphate synthase